MESKYLNYILAMAEYRNMTKAAEALYVSQSSLSQYLARLEGEIGTPLFNRTKSELSLTAAGELYVDAANKILKIQKDLYHDIAGLDSRGHISVGVTSNFGLRMLSEIIPKYKTEFPGISIEITEVGLPQLKKLFLEDCVDIGIAATAPNVTYAANTHILRVEDIFFAIPINHPYARINTSDTITIPEFLNYFSDASFVRSKKGASIRSLTEELFEANKFHPHVICETNNIATVRSMIANQNTVGFVSESCSVDREFIKYYRMVPSMSRLNIVLVRNNWVLNEAEECFLRYLTNYFNQNSEKPYLAEHYTSSF